MINSMFIERDIVKLVYGYYIDGLTTEEILHKMNLYHSTDILINGLTK